MKLSSTAKPWNFSLAVADSPAVGTCGPEHVVYMCMRSTKMTLSIVLRGSMHAKIAYTAKPQGW